MSFFHGSSDVTVDNSCFSQIGGDININLITQDASTTIAQLLGKRKQDDNNEFDVMNGLRKRFRPSGRNSDGLKIIEVDEFELRTELLSRSSYRMHSASHGAQGRVVAVKVFEGPRAKEDWMRNMAIVKKLLHPNTMAKIVGVSDENSEVPYIVYHGISEKKIQPSIVEALRTDLSKNVELSKKTVKGLAAGLNYIKSQQRSGALVDVRGWENFDIFAGENGEPIITIHIPSAPRKSSLPPHSFTVQGGDHGVESLNDLCQKLFSEVNSVLYADDSSRQEFDTYDAEGLPTASIEEVSDTQAEDISEKEPTAIPRPSNSLIIPKLNQTPRREVQWRLGTGGGYQN